VTGTVFVDTSAWLALANRSDRLHRPAVERHRELLAGGAHYLTTEPVLTEVANALARPPLRQAAIRFVDALRASPRVAVVPVDGRTFARGWELYRDRPDKPWGLTDCISFVVMAEHDVREAFAADRHFEQAGYTCLLSPTD